MIIKGYNFTDFVSLRRWERQNINSSLGQLVFGDGLFLRSPEYMYQNHADNPMRVRRYLSICALYNRFELMEALLKILPQFSSDIAPIQSKLTTSIRRFVTIQGLSTMVRELTVESNSHGLYHYVRGNSA